MDWNKDGKVDSKDAVCYNTVINPPKEKANKPTLQQSTTQAGESGGLAINLLCLGYLGVLLPGEIPINTFTMIIGLICAGRLGYCFLKWVYS